ncbi:aldehyde dehydrogenase EutE, partial [bacterium]|nr:aldehyde dehydrogenase EutE [bacterium]
ASGPLFTTVDEAVSGAEEAQRALMALPLERRKEIIASIRRVCTERMDELAQLAVSETGMGIVADKVQKNLLAIKKTPGVEDLQTAAFSGDRGLTIEELAPFGVIGAITPSTNPSETVISNAIGMVAAGNSVIFNAHPGAKKVSARAVELVDQAIVSAGGPRNVVCCLANPTIATGQEMMRHKGVRLLVVTGGPAVVRAAMSAGKKVIAAGPGNPPVVVDETADLELAAQEIVNGASFDHNVLCVSEKEVFVVQSIAEELKRGMVANGAYELSPAELAAVLKTVYTDHTPSKPFDNLTVNRNLVGHSAAKIMQTAGLSLPTGKRLLIVETDPLHPLVMREMLMPLLPIVKAANVDEAIEWAYRAEAQRFHSAMMYSRNIANLNKMANRMNTSIFVKNGPSYAGLGFGGEGHTSYTIAGATGEGVTTARTFTRRRRCVLVDYFRIV